MRRLAGAFIDLQNDRLVDGETERQDHRAFSLVCRSRFQLIPNTS